MGLMTSGRSTGRRGALAAVVAAAATACVALTAAAPATSAPSGGGLATVVAIPASEDQHCTVRRLTGPGLRSVALDTRPLPGDSYNVVEARLRGPARGDWDVAVFDAADGRLLAASTYRGSHEVATGYDLDGGAVVTQVCRLSGDAGTARLTVRTRAVDPARPEVASLATVATPTRADKEALQRLGLDLTEHGRKGHVAVVLHGGEDRRALDRAGLEYEVEVADLDAQSARQRAAERRFAARATTSALPSGRQTYRRLFHYTQDMKALAEQNPNLVRPLTLPLKTYEGRPVEGIEITTGADNLRDGKPVFLQMGVHHAREWPSGEHAMEWAYELVEGYKSGDPRVRRLVENVRTIIVPVVNPDGFNASREAGEQQGHGNGQDGSFLTTFPASPNEYRRKNCRLPDDSDAGNCAQPAFGIQSGGVDVNRNYGGFWGGPGASDLQIDEDYRGPGPFSERESRNIRSLVSHRQVTVLITNHTFSNLVLRPPGLASQPDPVDEPIYKALGDAMAAQNGYLSQKGYELYDTSGTTEDWSYNATGGLGFTFEIYCDHVPDPIDPRCGGNFHPTFPHTIAEYEGGPGSDAPPGGGGNREAYFLAMEAAADPSKHSVLEGTAPPGAVITLQKTFDTPTMNDPPSVRDHLETQMVVPGSGRFDYHINPSTRPLVAQDQGRQAQGPPSGPITFSGGPNPATNAPCGSAETEDPNCYDDHPFEITNPAGVDNDSATVRIEWTSPASDWDMFVYRDVNENGVSDAGDIEVGSSTQGNTDNESTTFVRPEMPDGRLEPGRYVVRVVNFAAVEPYSGEVSFTGPEEFIPARTETWRLTCSFAGQTRVEQDVLIDRGERKSLDLGACGRRVDPETGRPVVTRCRGKVARLVGTAGPNRIIGTPRRDVIVTLGGNDTVRSRRGSDLVCAGRGNDKVMGWTGRDRLIGGPGRDRLRGGPAADTLIGSRGADRLQGGNGNDRLRGGGGNDRCGGGRGPDRLSGCERRLRGRRR